MGISVIEDNDGMDDSIDDSKRLTRLGNMIVDHKPVFIFSINFFPFLSIICQRLSLAYVAVSVDCPVIEIFHNSIRNSVNRVFLFDRSQYLSICAENPGHIFYLPLGAPCYRNDNLLGDRYKAEYDISFVGSTYKEKDPFSDIILSRGIREKVLQAMKKQIDSSAQGFDAIESCLSDTDISEIEKSIDDFDRYDNYVMNMERFVIMNNYIAPHMAYIERISMLKELAESFQNAKVHFFTRSETLELSKKVVIHDGVKTLTEMPFVFRNSKINLNVTLKSIQTGLPQRIWDVLSCRGFLLTNEQDEITDYFRPGVHLETYSDTNDLKKKIKYYLEHEDERQQIAQNGYEEVLSKHTTRLRAIEIIKTCLNIMENG